MYGIGYEEREYTRIVPEGDYEVVLGYPQDTTTKNGYPIRKIPVKIVGYEGYYPNEWTWFDRPTDDVEKMARWNSDRTRDADVFGVARGDFRPEAWQGKRGWVRIAKDREALRKFCGQLQLRRKTVKLQFRKKKKANRP
jgi:hypothetical protein